MIQRNKQNKHFKLIKDSKPLKTTHDLLNYFAVKQIIFFNILTNKKQTSITQFKASTD